ncbi:unnamed protein product [Heligmosomoides polygyrus]|uniref:Uncharacterized protein n=1 Tax=Heligmosomoides polygyrus TaxID=6339 RepID=A0A3P8D1F7_HELPZ|nr:unnamed protein product [Heligmosomoides polygyrus]
MSSKYRSPSIDIDHTIDFFWMLSRRMMFYAMISDIFVLFTIYVIRVTSIQLWKDFQLLIYSNILFPAIFCNVLCLILVPFFLLPYPAVCNLGSLRFGPESTVLYVAILVWAGVWTIMSILYSIALQYIIVCHSWLLTSRRFKTGKILAILIPNVFLVIVSVVAPYLMLSDRTTIPQLIAANSRNNFLEKYSVLIVHLYWDDALKYCFLAFLLAYAAAIIAGFTTVFSPAARVVPKTTELCGTQGSPAESRRCFAYIQMSQPIREWLNLASP